jgi:DNA polymerase
VPARVSRARSLAGLFRRMRCCTRCELALGRTRVVVGTGAAHAEIMFVGEAPGAQEDAAGEPFVGAAGRLFDSLLAGHEIARSDVFVTNVVACRPPANRTPKPREVAAHSPWLEEQIRLVDPRVIVTLGRAALTYFLPGAKITLLSGQPQPLSWQGRERTLLPLFHPAAALRARDLRPRLEEGFVVLRQLL